MITPTIGSFCTGYGGLDLGLTASLRRGQVVWHAEIDSDACRILKARWPDIPNLGDLRTADWSSVPSVDIVTAGYPCQPFSSAGKREGFDDERDLWPWIARALGVLRPRHVLLENVAGHLGRGLWRTVGDLAALGYDARWGAVRASDAGAPHRRERVFIVATNSSSMQPERRRATGDVAGAGGDAEREAWQRERRRDALVDRGPTAAHAGSVRRDGRADLDRDGRDEAVRREAGDHAGDRASTSATNADIPRLERREPAAGRDMPAGCDPGCTAGWEWRTDDGRDYGPAIRRWHDLTRCVPQPTIPRRAGRRLNPELTEWMMGLPPGWVTQVPGLTVGAQFRVLGNGVVPQQAAAAVLLLADTAAWPVSA